MMNNRSGKLNATANRRSVRIIESKIGRYIRGEISADLINKTNVQLAAREKQLQHQQNQHQQNATNHLRSKTRPPFRNMINVKNTGTSFLSAVSDLKRLKLDESKEVTVAVKPLVADVESSDGGCPNSDGGCFNSDSTIGSESTNGRACLCLAEPDVQGVCLCDQDVLRKFVPEPGVYVQTLKRKLTDVRSRNVDQQAILRALSQYDLDAAAVAAVGTNEDRNFEIWQCN